MYRVNIMFSDHWSDSYLLERSSSRNKMLFHGVVITVSAKTDLKEKDKFYVIKGMVEKVKMDWGGFISIVLLVHFVYVFRNVLLECKCVQFVQCTVTKSLAFFKSIYQRNKRKKRYFDRLFEIMAFRWLKLELSRVVVFAFNLILDGS